MVSPRVPPPVSTKLFQHVNCCVSSGIYYFWTPTYHLPHGLNLKTTDKVFGMAISTILQCFIADEEMFKGDDRYGEGDLGIMLDKAARSNNKGDTKVIAVEGGGIDIGAKKDGLP